MPRICSFSRVTLVSAALLVAALISPALSGAVPVGAPVGTQQQFTTFTPPTTDQGSYPVVAYNRYSQKTLAVWLDPVPVSSQAPNGTIVKAAFLGADGTRTSSPVDISTTLPSSRINYGDTPAVAVGPDGTWLVIWLPLDDAGSRVPIYGQVLDSSGNPAGPNFVLSSRSDYFNVEGNSVAWSPEEQRYLVTWKSKVDDAFPGAASNQQIVGRFVDAAGAGIGSDFLVTDTADGADNAEAIAYGNGRWIAVATTITNRRPFGQVVTAAGPQGGIFDLSDSAGVKMAPYIDYNPDTQQFAVVFRSAASNPGPEYLRLLDSTGAPVGSDIDLGGTGNRPNISSAGSLGYLASWHQGGGWIGTVYGVRVFADGTVAGPPVAISDSSPFQGFRPKSAYDESTGQFITVFGGRPSSTAPNNTFNNYARAWGLPLARLTVTPDGGGKGRITSSPVGIDCGSICSGLFDPGASVTLTATPEPGYVFAGWGGACSGTEATCTVPVAAATSVTAKFEKEPTPPGPTPGPTPSNTFQVRTPLLVGTGIRSLVRVPGEGVIRQAGTFRSGGKTRPACGSGSRAVSAAGTYRFRCRLSDAVRAARRKGAVRVRLVTTYTPTGGTARVVVRTVVLRSLKPKFTG